MNRIETKRWSWVYVLHVVGASLVWLFGSTVAADQLLDRSEALIDVSTVSRSGNLDCVNSPQLEFPSGRKYRRGAIVDVEYTRLATGFTADYVVHRETAPAFSLAALKFLQACRFSSAPADQRGRRFRVIFQTVGGTTARQTAILLRDVRASAANGTRGRKALYAYTLELATAFDGVLRFDESTLWYLKAAAEGHPRSSFEVGTRLVYGQRGFAQDTALGLAWLAHAADAGYGAAAWLLATDFEASDVTADARLRQAAESGHHAAQLALASRELSRGGSADLKSAGRWLRASKDSYDRLTWLRVAAGYELARGNNRQAQRYVEEGRALAASVGYPSAPWLELQARLAKG